MRTVIQRFLSFQAENVAPEIYWALGFVYCLLVAVCLASVSRSGIGGKLAWAMLILFIPFLGMYAYTVYTLARADYAFLKRFGLGAGGADPAARMLSGSPPLLSRPDNTTPIHLP